MPYGDSERETYPGEVSRRLTGELIVKAKERFKDAVDLDIYDPRSPIWLWDVIKFSVRGAEPVWIANGSLLFRGVPNWEDLEKALDACVKRGHK